MVCSTYFYVDILILFLPVNRIYIHIIHFFSANSSPAGRKENQTKPNQNRTKQITKPIRNANLTLSPHDNRLSNNDRIMCQKISYAYFVWVCVCMGNNINNGRKVSGNILAQLLNELSGSMHSYCSHIPYSNYFTYHWRMNSWNTSETETERERERKKPEKHYLRVEIGKGESNETWPSYVCFLILVRFVCC